jgi:hypothetical protein
MKMQMYVQLKEKEDQQEQEHLIKQEERLMSGGRGVVLLDENVSIKTRSTVVRNSNKT